MILCIRILYHRLSKILHYHDINKPLPVVYRSIRSIVADCKRVAEHPADKVFATFIGFSNKGSIYLEYYEAKINISKDIHTSTINITKNIFKRKIYLLKMQKMPPPSSIKDLSFLGCSKKVRPTGGVG